MSKKLPIIVESQEELLELFNKIQDNERRNRVHALYLVKMGFCTTRKAIGNSLRVGRKAVERWLKIYEQAGLQALLVSNRSNCGRKPKIMGEALSQLKYMLEKPAGFVGYNSIRKWLKERFCLDVPYKTVYGTVHYKLNSKPKVARKSNVRKDEKLEKEFIEQGFEKKLKEAQTENTRNLPVKVFTQDESRIGLMTIMRRVITQKGVKPVAKYQQKYKSFYLYGAVEPKTGDNFFFYFSHLDSVCFQIFIDKLSETFKDSFNIFLLDQGSFHTTPELIIPNNIYFIFQPPANPEVNPIERLWQYIKDRLALENYESIIKSQDAVSNILNNITLETFSSVTNFEYFQKALNGAFN